MNARHKSPSTQLMLGVSIDRSSGEGSTVTVRGFGPDFNLVLLNGRQMPTSTLGGSNGAPSSRSFDFGNLASEGIAAVEVYKSGRATLATGVSVRSSISGPPARWIATGFRAASVRKLCTTRQSLSERKSPPKCRRYQRHFCRWSYRYPRQRLLPALQRQPGAVQCGLA